MSTSYEEARRIALGLEKEKVALPDDNIWSVSLGGDFGLRAEMPYQFFEKSFEPPEEQAAQRAALMLYEEYDADRGKAKECLKCLKEALQKGDAGEVKKLLEKEPVEEWLSLIFLEGAPLRDELLPLIDGADASCRSVLAPAFEKALERMVDFRELLETLQKHCQ